MPSSPARSADDIADGIRSIVDRMADAKFTREMTKQGQELAALLADRGADVGERVEEAWKDSRPARKAAAKQIDRSRREAAKWSQRTWRKQLRPALRDLWKQRTVAVGAAGAAVPVGRELVDEAATRLGIKRREDRHWGAFFLGMLVGAALGAIAAMLATPKPGRDLRRDLTARAGEVRDEITTRAREVDWVPLFQRDDEVADNGGQPTSSTPAATTSSAPQPKPTPTTTPSAPVTRTTQEGVADAGTAGGEAAERAGDEAADAIGDAYEPADAKERDTPA